MSNQLPTQASDLLVTGVKGGAALYALDHAVKGTPIGQEGGPGAQAARTGGNFVIAALIFKFVILPFLGITAAIFAIPTALLSNAHSSATVPVFVISAILWVYLILWRCLLKGVIKTDRFLSGRDMQTGRRKRTMQTRKRTRTTNDFLPGDLRYLERSNPPRRTS